jgi:hypothetical protein
MAAQVKKITIDGKKYTIREIIVSEMLEIKRIIGGLENISDTVKEIDKILPYCSDITQDDLINMAPSDIETLWKAFKEVNKVFFSTMETFGLIEVINQIKRNLIVIFLEQSSKLMQPGQE